MKTIKELWNELEQHPDFIAGSLWTKQNVIDQLETFCDEDEDFSRIVELFVDENKTKIADRITEFEGTAYDYGCSWTDGIEDLIEEGSQKIFSYDSEIA